MDKHKLLLFIKYKLPAYIWGAIILILTSYPTISLPDIGIDFTDKVAHFGVYFILAFLVLWAIKENQIELKQKQWNKGILLSTIFAVFDELHQIPIPGRRCDIFDLLADVLGILCAVFLFKLLYVFISRSKENYAS